MDASIQRILKNLPKLPKGSHKGRQSLHNRKTGKYVRQFARTAANKIRKRAKHRRDHPNN